MRRKKLPDEDTLRARRLHDLLRPDKDDYKIMKKYWFFHPERSVTESAMVFGFDCGRGWLPLIDKFCQELEKLLEGKYPGYKTGKPSFEITQIKEKYGSLRIYTNFTNDDIEALIEKYEALSLKTCEECGEKGSPRNIIKGWIRTLCNKCFRKLKEDNDEAQFEAFKTSTASVEEELTPRKIIPNKRS
jgi:hypothetical protein